MGLRNAYLYFLNGLLYKCNNIFWFPSFDVSVQPLTLCRHTLGLSNGVKCKLRWSGICCIDYISLVPRAAELSNFSSKVYWLGYLYALSELLIFYLILVSRKLIELNKNSDYDMFMLFVLL